MPWAVPTHKGVEMDGAGRHCARGTTKERGYDSKWKRASVSYRKRHPLCVHCLARDRTEPATEVDHIIPHRGDYNLMWDQRNWQSLCRACHGKKSARERQCTIGTT